MHPFYLSEEVRYLVSITKLLLQTKYLLIVLLIVTINQACTTTKKTETVTDPQLIEQLPEELQEEERIILIPQPESKKTKSSPVVSRLLRKSKVNFEAKRYSEASNLIERGINISSVKEKLVEIYESNYQEKSVTLKAFQSKLVSQIHSLAEVTKSEYIDDEVKLTYKTDSTNHNKIERLLDAT